MPASVDTATSSRPIALKTPAPKRRPQPKARKRRVATPTPDQADRTREARAKEVTASQSPDTQDRNRSSAQKATDKKAVQHSVTSSREKALRKKNAGSWGRALKKAVKDTYEHVYGAGGTMRGTSVSESEAAALRRRGKHVGVTSGATMSVKTIGTGGPVRMAQAIGVATAEDPKRVGKNTLKGARDMAMGAPAGLVKTLTQDPRTTLKEIGGDYKRRYGGLDTNEGFAAQVERIKEEGAAAEIADAVSIGVPAGKAADALGGALARSGKLGARLKSATTKARPKIRTSGGDAVDQKRSRGLTGALRENRKDRQAREAVARDVTSANAAATKAASKASGAHTPKKGEVDAVVREAFDKGEVVPTRRSRPGRRVVSQRQIERAQRRAYAREKGMGLAAQRAEQREEIFRGANKNLAGLNAKEQRAFKYAMETGAETPAAGVQTLTRLRTMIHDARANGRDTPNVDTDELPTINTILADPHGHFTPRLKRAVRLEIERGARVGEGDPALGQTALERAETAEARRTAPQADVLAVTRKGTPVQQAIHNADQAVKGAQRKREKARARRDRLAQRRAAAEGYAQHGVDQQKRVLDHQIAQAEHVKVSHEAVAAGHRAKAHRARYAHTRAEYIAKARKADARAAVAAKRVQSLKDSKSTLNRGYRKAVQKARGAEHNAQRELDTRAADVRARGADARSVRAAKRKGAKLIGGEPMKDFHARVAAARPAGVGEPGFFPSVKRETTRFSPFTIGGARRAKPDRGYTGKLFRAGREDGSITTYTQALAKNIKRKYNWKLVQDTMVAHAFSWSAKTLPSGKVTGLKYGEVMDELARRGVDPSSVRIMDMDAFDAGAISSGSLHGTLSGAMDPAAIDKAARLEPGAGRLIVVPKHVGDEILSDTKPSGALGRGLDVMKGKSARIMLGLSPAWLQYQVAANGIQTALATKALPAEWVYANMKWWKSLSKDEQRALEPYVGIGSFHDALETPKMGAAATGGLINSYRAFKAHDFWHKPRGAVAGGRSISQLNPLDTLFRLDNAQNNFFRKAVLYNALKKQAYEGMGKSMVSGQKAIDKALGGWGGVDDVHAQMKSLVGDRKALEDAAESVHDFLGDYMTYTSKERRVLQRNVMFYGYLRWSLKFAFYTMPVKHPVMTAIIGQLGGMNAREVKELLGGDELPWSLGKIYFTRNGELKSVDLSRANPFMNAVTGSKIPEKGAIRGAIQSAIGFLPPVYGALLDVAYSKSNFKDKPLKVDGESTARPNKQGQSITDTQAGRIFLRSMLTLAAPIRAADRIRADGRPVSDDSIPFVHERYTNYKDAAIRADVRKAQNDETTGGRLLHEALPLVPVRDRSPDVAAKIRRAKGERGNVNPVASSQGGATPDDEQSKLIDFYANQAADQDVDADELDKLIQTYGGG